MAKRKSKKLRGSRGSLGKDNCDLMVPVPKTAGGVSSLECKLLVREIKNRLASTGYKYMALTHTIYGRPKQEDRASVAIPSSLWTSSSIEQSNKSKKKRKLNDSLNREGNTIRILRRIHVVLENQSDTGFYLSNGPQEDLLNEYDIVSICPTNDVTFQSACYSTTMADIITLDYSTRGLKLPYRIRTSDVKAAMERGAAFEIPIAPALLHLKQRKSLVHACQELKNSSLGLKPCLVISSGDRTFEGNDVGALALRMPGDISNLCKTVMHFDDSIAFNAIGAAAMQAVQRGKERRCGQKGMAHTRVVLMSRNDIAPSPPSVEDEQVLPKTKASSTETGSGAQEDDVTSDDNDNDDADDVVDGFIAF
mmetsp:Transcript_14968/g.31039  ORF Transcript_14968/g.31039 Transcript_14968/m.31039 type:complete len:365 (-) Transcript_14968:76-1170(-)